MGIAKRIKGKKLSIRIAAAMAAFMLAAAPSLAYAKTAASESVEKMIEALPPMEEVGEKDAENVRSVMESYMALSFAEQTDISQELYDRLKDDYDQCLNSGYITDIQKEAEAVKEEEERTAREQEALTPSEETEIGVTSYTFAITPDVPTTSITMRFTVDIDGDKLPDPPSVIMVTTPTGEMFDVSVSDVEMKTEGHHVIYTWTDKFLQLDVAKAENGNWKIETSDPCVFSRMEYAGMRLDITPEKEKEDTQEITPENDGGGSAVLALAVILIAVIGLAAAAVKVLGIELPSLPAPKGKKRGKASEEEEEEEEEDEAPYEPSDEEVNEIIREEVRKRKQEAEEMDLSAEDEPLEEEDDEGDNGFIMYKEGETGLLDGKNSPFGNGGGLVEDEETDPYVPAGNDSAGDDDDDDFFDDGMFD